jgi:formiminotetrahydrofolate cyclodeaminase
MAERTAATLERIIAVPEEIVRIAAEVAELAALVAAEGNPNVSGDAAAGADLAAAAASIAARMVAINAPESDERIGSTQQRAEAAAELARRTALRDMS